MFYINHMLIHISVLSSYKYEFQNLSVIGLTLLGSGLLGEIVLLLGFNRLHTYTVVIILM
jgi:hypothetical protein